MEEVRDVDSASRELRKNKSSVGSHGSLRKEEKRDTRMVNVWRKADRGKAQAAYFHLLQQPQG